jgi:hypothetical protein
VLFRSNRTQRRAWSSANGKEVIAELQARR